MDYSSLTNAQREQVAFLFCDEIFGTDPEGFEYELTGETVTGRTQKAESRKNIHARKARQVKVNVSVKEVVSDEGQRLAATTIKEIARRIVARMIQVQPQEA